MAHNNESDIDERTGHLGQSLKGLKFPADKFTIINHARANQLDFHTLSIIIELPERQYIDLRDVLAHFIGGMGRAEDEDESPAGHPL